MSTSSTPYDTAVDTYQERELRLEQRFLTIEAEVEALISRLQADPWQSKLSKWQEHLKEIEVQYTPQLNNLKQIEQNLKHTLDEIVTKTNSIKHEYDETSAMIHSTAREEARKEIASKSEKLEQELKAEEDAIKSTTQELQDIMKEEHMPCPADEQAMRLAFYRLLGMELKSEKENKLLRKIRLVSHDPPYSEIVTLDDGDLCTTADLIWEKSSSALL